MIFRFMVISAFALLMLCQSPVVAAPKKSDGVVKISTTAGKVGEDGKQEVQVEIVIDKGWHLYANPAGNDRVAESQVTVTGSGVINVVYPEGELVKDKDIGDFRVYYNKTTIKLVVDRNKAGSGSVELSVKVAACNENSCLLPAVVKVSVP